MICKSQKPSLATPERGPGSMIMKAFALMAIALICLSCASRDQAGHKAANRDDAAPGLESMSYLSTWFSSGRVTLSHGEFRESAAPGSASEIVVKLSDKRAFGKVNGKDTGAVIIYTHVGGTGTFCDLALLTKEAEGWVNTYTVLLGDRVKVLSVEIRDDTIDPVMIMHGPGDPLCCPTLQVTKRFAVQENRLVPVTEEAQKKGVSSVIGPVWQWIETLHNDGKKTVPSRSKDYTLQLLEDGKLNVRADCNLKGGKYSIQERFLSIEITHSTMAACPDGSLEDQFIRGLTAAASYFLKNGDLYIDLKFDSGTMKFQRDKGAGVKNE